MEMDRIQTGIAMGLYMLVVIGIGIYFARRAHRSTKEYFLGGRSLGPWVSAMSAEASDMSGWLLMGLPGTAYWLGLADAGWTAIGLAVGTYLNWLLVARRLRVYSHIAGDAITLPDYISNRFREKKPLIMAVAALFILIFFTVYAASCFVTLGKLFSTVFGASYVSMVIVGALFVVTYTFLGGFLAESVSDFLQAIVMIFALVAVLGLGVAHAGGLEQVRQNIGQIPGFLSFFGMAAPTMEAGQQVISGKTPAFGAAVPYGFITIISTVSWGLGYFGMPQVLLRFMAVRKASDLKLARRVATIWVVISLGAAVLIGLIGRAVFPVALRTPATAENIFILTAQSFLPPFLAGIVMAGILAATISSSDSYLLIASSAVAKNFYQHIFHRKATDRQVMRMTRVILIAITAIAVLLALDENSVIFQIVSFAWAGFGATFGPIMLFSVFSRRVTRQGALAGMIAGGGMVFIWKLLIRPLGGAWNLYELGPAFLFSALVILLVSRLTRPEADVLTQHDQYLQELAKTD